MTEGRSKGYIEIPGPDGILKYLPATDEEYLRFLEEQIYFLSKVIRIPRESGFRKERPKKRGSKKRIA